MYIVHQEGYYKIHLQQQELSVEGMCALFHAEHEAEGTLQMGKTCSLNSIAINKGGSFLITIYEGGDVFTLPPPPQMKS